MRAAISISSSIIKKYNVAAPRYTSYPTVPYWDSSTFNKQDWVDSVKRSFIETNTKKGISVYIHLPYCESLCTYCGCNTRITVNHQVEEPYIASVLREWKMYLDVFGEKPRISQLHLGGGTPTFFKPENLKRLIEGIFENSEVLPDAELSFEAHPANTTLLHLKTLFNLGFKRLSLGIQDFDTHVQEIINRKQSFESVKKVTELALQIGYTSINYDLIYGLPLQSLTSIEDTLQKVISLRPHRIAFYSYAHVPWIKPGQRRYTDADLPVEDEKLAIYARGHELFINAGYRDIGMDHFALPEDELCRASDNKQLHRNFMGYTTQSATLLVGLGVSSISDSWTAFAQNHKTIEEYHDAINKNELPVIRGHILTNEDLVLRKHILNLMCNFETDWNQSNFVPLLNEALIRLKDMEKDGLVELFSNKIIVTEKGKRFVRNVCMALDARLIEKQPQTKLFSAAV